MERHQRGYIYEAHNAFHIRYYVTENGSRKQKSHRLCTKDRSQGYGSPSARAVRELAEDHLRSVGARVQNTSLPMGVSEFWDTIYLPFLESGNVKPATLYSYKHVWSKYLKDHFGKIGLAEYRTPKMSVFLTGLAKTLRPRTLKHIKFLASGIFAHAVATGHCETNPIRDAKILGKTLGDGVTGSYTLEEIENAITALVDNVKAQAVMALCFFAGLRKGEIQGLQWGDIDNDFIHVRRNFSRNVLSTPKTVKAIRAVPLIAPVRLFLELWRVKCPKTAMGWCFPNERGKAHDMDAFAMREIKPKLGERWKGFHAGRRGLGTQLKRLTGTSLAGKEVLGHTTETVTQTHYEAPLPEEALRGMKLLEEATQKGVKQQ